MSKKFNVTGKCSPGQHYMADTSAKMQQAMDLVDSGEYFIINRPRQFGKTTALYTLAQMLRENGGYIVLNTTFEGVGDLFFSDEKAFSQQLVLNWEKYAGLSAPEGWAAWLREQSSKMETLADVSRLITELTSKTEKRTVLMIDEVDKSSNNQLFVSFLAMLRSKYLERGDFRTFHSVVLAGVHDVKSLKLKLRPGEEQKLNSPWNIAADFNVQMELLPHEIVPMLEDYSRERVVSVDAPKIADLLFFYTSGYPFLVSKLCKIFDETLLPRKNEKTFTEQDVEDAVGILLEDNNPNFENLIKNLENNEELYQLTYAIVIEAEKMPFNRFDSIANLGLIHGIFGRDNGSMKIHNRIYQELIGDFMVFKTLRTNLVFRQKSIGSPENPDKTLDMESLLLRFQDLMKEEYNQKDRDFLEREGRLVFLSFLKPILNGNGHAFKEPQISEERRLDILISYFKKKYLIELKIWRGEKAHQKGILQLADYLERQNLERGYLVVFDHSATKTWAKKRIRKAGKKIFAVWV